MAPEDWKTRYADSRDVPWNLDDDTVFLFLGTQWDVGAAKQMLAASKHELCLVAAQEYAAFCKQPRKLYEVSSMPRIQSYIEVSDESVKNADVTFPCILVPLGDAHHSAFPIDGWGRILRALCDRVQMLPAFCLTSDEAKRITRRII